MRILALVLLVLPLWSFHSEGPFEKAGRSVDESVDNVREAAEDVIEDVREGVEDVSDNVERKRRK